MHKSEPKIDSKRYTELAIPAQIDLLRLCPDAAQLTLSMYAIKDIWHGKRASDLTELDIFNPEKRRDPQTLTGRLRFIESIGKKERKKISENLSNGNFLEKIKEIIGERVIDDEALFNIVKFMSKEGYIEPTSKSITPELQRAYQEAMIIAKERNDGFIKDIKNIRKKLTIKDIQEEGKYRQILEEIFPEESLKDLDFHDILQQLKNQLGAYEIKISGWRNTGGPVPLPDNRFAKAIVVNQISELQYSSVPSVEATPSQKVLTMNNNLQKLRIGEKSAKGLGRSGNIGVIHFGIKTFEKAEEKTGYLGEEDIFSLFDSARTTFLYHSPNIAKHTDMFVDFLVEEMEPYKSKFTIAHDQLQVKANGYSMAKKILKYKTGNENYPEINCEMQYRQSERYAISNSGTREIYECISPFLYALKNGNSNQTDNKLDNIKVKDIYNFYHRVGELFESLQKYQDNFFHGKENNLSQNYPFCRKEIKEFLKETLNELENFVMPNSRNQNAHPGKLFDWELKVLNSNLKDQDFNKTYGAVKQKLHLVAPQINKIPKLIQLLDNINFAIELTGVECSNPKSQKHFYDQMKSLNIVDPKKLEILEIFNNENIIALHHHKNHKKPNYRILTNDELCLSEEDNLAFKKQFSHYGIPEGQKNFIKK